MVYTRKKIIRTPGGDGLDDDQKTYLLHGVIFTGCEYPFKNEKAEQKAWKTHKNDLLAEWVLESPGTRPGGWWKFETHGGKPENELKTVGKGCYHKPNGELSIYDIQEEQYDYLKRNDLLLNDEPRPDNWHDNWDTKLALMRAYKEATRKTVIGVDFKEKKIKDDDEKKED
jgi:hypothetical protein